MRGVAKNVAFAPFIVDLMSGDSTASTKYSERSCHTTSRGSGSLKGPDGTRRVYGSLGSRRPISRNLNDFGNFSGISSCKQKYLRPNGEVERIGRSETGSAQVVAATGDRAEEAQHDDPSKFGAGGDGKTQVSRVTDRPLVVEVEKMSELLKHLAIPETPNRPHAQTDIKKAATISASRVWTGAGDDR